MSVPFDDAWTTALKGARWPHSTDDRRAAKEILAETREEWEAAYEDRPTSISILFERISLAPEEPDVPELGAVHLGDAVQVLPRISSFRGAAV